MLKIEKINKYINLINNKRYNELNKLLIDKKENNEFSYSEIFISCWLCQKDQLATEMHEFMFYEISKVSIEPEILKEGSSAQSAILIKYLIQIVYLKKNEMTNEEKNLINSLLIVSISRKHDFNLYTGIMILVYSKSKIMQNPKFILENYESNHDQYKKMIKLLL